MDRTLNVNFQKCSKFGGPGAHGETKHLLQTAVRHRTNTLTHVYAFDVRVLPNGSLTSIEPQGIGRTAFRRSTKSAEFEWAAPCEWTSKDVQLLCVSCCDYNQLHKTMPVAVFQQRSNRRRIQKLSCGEKPQTNLIGE